MNWEAIGAIGEIIGAFGVIATLFYVAYQLKQSAKQTAVNALALDGATQDAASQLANGLRLTIAEDRGMAEVYTKGLADPEALDQVDQIRFRLIIDSQIELFQLIQNQILQGRRSDAEWENVVPFIKRSFLAKGSRWYWENFQENWSGNIRTAINDILDEDETENKTQKS